MAVANSTDVLRYHRIWGRALSLGFNARERFVRKSVATQNGAGLLESGRAKAEIEKTGKADDQSNAIVPRWKQWELHRIALSLLHSPWSFAPTMQFDAFSASTPECGSGAVSHPQLHGTLAELCSLLPERKPNARVDKAMVLKALHETAYRNYGKSKSGFYSVP